jgi:single-strand DNA-binding protein
VLDNKNIIMFWQNPNRVILGGNITFDPQIKDVSNTKVVEFSIANNQKATGGNSKAHFFKCEAWGKTAENISEFFKKGDPILIEGALNWHSWQDQKSGEKREAVKIRVESFFFPGGSSKKSDSAPANNSNVRVTNNVFPPLPNEGKSGVELYTTSAEDDDIPFN